MDTPATLVSLEQASEMVRSFSGDYPVCIITSPRGADILRPILDQCSFILNGVEIKLMTDHDCTEDAAFFLPKSEFDKFMKARGKDS